MMHLLVRGLVEVALPRARLVRAAVEGAREVGIIAVTTDHVGIQTDQLVRPDDPVAGLLEPGVGARAGVQQPGLAVVTALGDHLGPEFRPKLIFRDAGPDRAAQPGDAALGGAQRGDDAFHLLRRLDRAGALHGRLRVDQGEALGGQRGGRAGVDALDA